MFALKVVEETKSKHCQRFHAALCRRLIVVWIDEDEFVQIFSFY